MDWQENKDDLNFIFLKITLKKYYQRLRILLKALGTNPMTKEIKNYTYQIMT
jgi:hypothetical protein